MSDNETDLDELEGEADEMEERLAENEQMEEEIEVPEPKEGEDLDITDED